ncbi:hypothetical protein PR048_009133 [Dryococelus australis]|uniref:Uncharacterized protein n=1 Tax=Dryococelus australis TaxID=614101 RepID=A0ABQ9HZ20_9NEOP|nr:hypothetical protein PR048_009133 [Dryococelus australis]
MCWTVFNLNKLPSPPIKTEEFTIQKVFAWTTRSNQIFNVSIQWEHIKKILLPLFEGLHFVFEVSNSNCYKLKHPNTGNIEGKFNFLSFETL